MVKIIALLFCAGCVPRVFADACSPDYQVTRSTCHTTDKVEKVEDQNVRVRVVAGACNPDATTLCEQYDKNSVARMFPGSSVNDVKMIHPSTENAIGKLCGSPLDGSVRVKEDVYCSYSVRAPTYEKITGPDCPIKGVHEASGCFAGQGPVEIRPDFAEECLSQNLDSDASVWIKAACLNDLFRAQLNFRLKGDLGNNALQRIHTQLQALQMRSETPANLRGKITATLKSATAPSE